MRLVCPNCKAQYEVPDSVVPPEGRDVQCSNCGTTWLARPEGAEAAAPRRSPEAEPRRSARPEPRPEARAVPDAPRPRAEPREEPREAPREAPRPAMPPEASRRPIPQEVMDILREEAAREAAARAEEAARNRPAPVAPEVISTLSPEEQQAEAARERMARLRATRPTVAAPVAPEPERSAEEAVSAAMAADLPEEDEPERPEPQSLQGSRRALLPDIEEINQSLRPAAERGVMGAETAAAAIASERRGFRWGYAVILGIAGIAALAYAFSPELARLVPPARPALVAYVAAVDEARLWLDLQLQSLIGPASPADAAPDTAAEPAAPTGG